VVLSGICTTRRQGRTVPRRSRVGLGVFITRRQGGGVSQDRPRWSVKLYYPGCRQGSTESRPGSLHYPQAGWWGSPGKWARWSVRGAVLPAGRVDSSPKKTKNLTSARHQHKTTRQLTTTHAGTHQLEGGYDCDTTPCHRLHAVFGAGGLGTFDEVATETSLPSGRPNAQGFWPASWYQLV